MATIIRNFSFVLVAQITILLISIARAIILPKFLSIEGFGYWEIYWFYSSYVVLFCFGYNDGLYLNYGGYNITDLPAKLIRTANKVLLTGLIIISISVVSILLLTGNNLVRFPFIFVLLNIPVVCLTGTLIYIFQITNKFKDYTLFSTLDKILVMTVILILLFINNNNYKYVIVADFIGRIIVLSIMIFKLRSFVFGEYASINEAIRFLWDNSSSGIKLMIANLMGMLLIGGGKIIVQIFGDIEEFATYSFGFSITGLILTAVSAVSLVLYPSIKRISRERYPQLFVDVNTFTQVIGGGALLLYFPCYLFLSWYYPQYVNILPYLNAFFLIVYANIKISVLTNTFFNAIRLERQLLIANICCVSFFMITGVIFYNLMPYLWVIAACTSMAMLLRYIVCEYYLSSKYHTVNIRRQIVEIIFLVLFVCSTSLLSLSNSFVIVLIAYLIWILFNKRQIEALIGHLRK